MVNCVIFIYYQLIKVQHGNTIYSVGLNERTREKQINSSQYATCTLML